MLAMKSTNVGNTTLQTILPWSLLEYAKGVGLFSENQRHYISGNIS